MLASFIETFVAKFCVNVVERLNMTFVFVEQIEDSDREQQCTVITQNETQKLVPCNSFYPFLCTRNAGRRNIFRDTTSSDIVAMT